jgi:hypothetical protein
MTVKMTPKADVPRIRQQMIGALEAHPRPSLAQGGSCLRLTTANQDDSPPLTLTDRAGPRAPPPEMVQHDENLT